MLCEVLLELLIYISFTVLWLYQCDMSVVSLFTYFAMVDTEEYSVITSITFSWENKHEDN